LEVEERVEAAERLLPGVLSPDLICDLHAARRDLAAFSSDIAEVMTAKSDPAIAHMLTRH
jgi:hypothetical protein